jgi:hypothetical protein
MIRVRSTIGFLLAACLLLSVFASGCGWIDPSEKEIQTTVTSYLDEIQSGTFAENRYLSSFTKDDPFSTMTFKDAAAMACMNTSLRIIQYEIVESSGNKADQTGMCTVLVTAVDIDKILNALKDEWVTTESLNRAIGLAEAPTIQEKVILFMEYDPSADAWMISNSAAMAVVLGVPYSKINLFSQAGLPEDAFALFMKALVSGEAEKINPFIKTFSTYGLLFPEDGDMSVRSAFFEQVDYEIQDVKSFGDTCEMEVLLDYTDMQDIADRLIQDVGLTCEMYKIILTGLLADAQTASIEAYRKLNTQLWISNINSPDTARLQETFVFHMVPAEEGTQWRFKELPAFMTAGFVSSEEPEEDVRFSAVGMALIELCDEGVITEPQRDETLAQFGLQDLKYSSRQVMASYVHSAVFDVNGFNEISSFDAKTTEEIGISVEFDRDWSDMVIYAGLFMDGSEEPIGNYSLEAGSDFPKLFTVRMSFEEGSLWQQGKYRLEIYLVDRTSVASLDFVVD